MFLEISQNLQENTCVGASFLIKLQALAMQLYKEGTPKQVFFCEFREIFKDIFFYRTVPLAAFEMPTALLYYSISCGRL